MSKPVLWHIPVSHYNEKVRWALAWKGVEHERKAPPPGAHMAVALWLTRGAHKTFPVLTLDGRSIGDSTAIVAALEERWPEPPLYPADPAERRRALELEDFFDEELGPHIRLLVWHEMTRAADGPGMGQVAVSALPAALSRFAPVRAGAGAFGSAYVKLRFGVSDVEAAARARLKLAAAMDRLESELGDDQYLVGGRFTVADLTAASLFYPLARPPEGPQIITQAPPALEEFVARFRDRPGTAYVTEMFARHRKPAARAVQPA
jgi:glutathione S-transferase